MQVGSSRAIGAQMPIRAISGKRSRLRQLQQKSRLPQGKLMLARYYGSNFGRLFSVDPVMGRAEGRRKGGSAKMLAAPRTHGT